MVLIDRFIKPFNDMRNKKEEARFETKSHPSNFLPQRLIERSSGRDDLREHGGAGEGSAELGAGAHIGDAVESLGPPLVALDAEPGHGDGIVDHEPDLLRQCEPRNEVLHPHVDWHVRVAKLETPRETVPRVACKGHPPFCDPWEEGQGDTKY